MTLRALLVIAISPCLLLFAPAVRAYRDANQAVNYGSFKYVTAIATSTTRAYVATTDGIIVFNKSENRWQTPLTGAPGLDGGGIRQIWVDRFDQYLYAQTSLGLYELDLTFDRWLPLTDLPTVSSNDRHPVPPAVMFAPAGFNYNGNGGLIDQQGRLFNMTDIVDDGTGNLWIGTWGYGVIRANNASNVMELLPYGLLQNPICALVERDSVLYMAGPVGGLARTGITMFDLRSNSFRYIESGAGLSIPVEDVRCLDVDSTDIYVGTARGLYAVGRKTGGIGSRIDQILDFRIEDFTSLLVTGDSLFAGTSDGLFLIRRHGDSITSVGGREFYRRIIYDLKKVGSYLWIGSDAGAYRLSLSDGHLQKFQDPDKLLFDRVFSICVSERNLWLSSDGGIVQIDIDSGKTIPHRLLSRQVGSRPVAANDSIAAVSSDHGLTILFLDNGRPFSRDFSTRDGLLSDNIYGLVMDGDYLWIGSDRGLTRFWWSNPDVSD